MGISACAEPITTNTTIDYLVSVETASHPDIALYFVLLALPVGALVLSANRLMSIPYAAKLFLIGIILGVLHEGTQSSTHYMLGDISLSLEMWYHINPHVLSSVFLPVLVFADAMKIDIHMFRKCFWQCLLLSGPLVALNCLLLAGSLMYLFSWDFYLAMTVASAICSVDPVATVALLEPIGTKPKLTMIMGGESHLGDLLALTLFQVFLNLHLSPDLPPLLLARNIFFTGFVGFIVGGVIGVIFYVAIQKNHDHTSRRAVMVQISLTITLAYLSFVIAEQQFAANGVTSTFTAAICIAAWGWPVFASKTTMSNVWRLIEYFATTVIFLLAGVIIGKKVFRRYSSIAAVDVGFVFAMYGILQAARFILIGISFPVLSRLGYGLFGREAIFMSWCGIRGAISLILAIILEETLLDVRSQTLAIIVISGVVMLTLLINATTVGYLAKYLGLLSQPLVKKYLINFVHRRFHDNALEVYEKLRALPKYEKHDHTTIIQHVSSLQVPKLVDANVSPGGKTTIVKKGTSEPVRGKSVTTTAASAANYNAPVMIPHIHSTSTATGLPVPQRAQAPRPSFSDIAENTTADDGATSLPPRKAHSENNATAVSITINDDNNGNPTATTTSARSQPQRKSVFGMQGRKSFFGGNLDGSQFAIPGVDLEALQQARKAITRRFNEFTRFDKRDFLALVRELFLNALRAAYWQQIVEGIIPKGSRTAQKLLKSVENALDRIYDGLFDYALLDLPKTIMEIAAPKYHSYLDKLAKLMPQSIQERIGSAVHKQYVSDMVYMASCLIYAHRTAGKILLDYIGGDTGATTTPEFAQVLAESKAEVEQALAYMTLVREVDPEIVGLVQNKKIVSVILEKQKQFADALHNKGILDSEDHHELLLHIRKDLKRIRTMRLPGETQKTARAAALPDVVGAIRGRRMSMEEVPIPSSTSTTSTSGAAAAAAAAAAATSLSSGTAANSKRTSVSTNNRDEQIQNRIQSLRRASISLQARPQSLDLGNIAGGREGSSGSVSRDNSKRLLASDIAALLEEGDEDEVSPKAVPPQPTEEMKGMMDDVDVKRAAEAEMEGFTDTPPTNVAIDSGIEDAKHDTNDLPPIEAGMREAKMNPDEEYD